MTRRLSITVPDDLWDAVSHMNDSQSGLVQQALRCLRDTNGAPGLMTPVEVGATEMDLYSRVLDNLTEQATKLRSEGYDAVIVALDTGEIDLDWLELITRYSSRNKLQLLLAKAADLFLALRSDDPERTGDWLKRRITTDELSQLIPAEAFIEEWGDVDHSLLTGTCRIIVAQDDGQLAQKANGSYFSLDPDYEPATQIPLSLWEGMAAAIFDIVAAVRRRVLTADSMRRHGDEDAT